MTYTVSTAVLEARRRQGAKRRAASKRHEAPRAYTSWSAMKTRCTNPNHNRFEFYGGRGISYCDRWESFENFFEDMGERPEGFTLERKDGDLDYCPENCEWADYSTQNRNKRKGSKEYLPRVF